MVQGSTGLNMPPPNKQDLQSLLSGEAAAREDGTAGDIGPPGRRVGHKSAGLAREKYSVLLISSPRMRSMCGTGQS